MIFKPDFSRLILKGPDAKSFLHRISTNSVLDLKNGDTCTNVLVDAKGRMVEWFHQLMLSDDEILLIATSNRGKDLCNWLEQFHFIEDLEIIDVTSSTTLLWQQGLPPDGWFVIPSGNSHFLYSPVLRVDLEPDVDLDTFECLRIASCTPKFPNEINASYNPLELGLDDAIHWSKGCYIGQEVISKIDTYQKRRRHLTGVICNEQEFSQLKLENGITSIAPRYTKNQAVALKVY